MASDTFRCPNCSEPIQVDYHYCPYCGQKNTSKVVPLREVVTEALQSFFSFDSRFFRSIGPLFFRPGTLTIAFIKGKRRKFVTPLRMYLFSSIIYFSLLSLSAQLEPEPSHSQEGTITFTNEGINIAVGKAKTVENDTLDNSLSLSPDSLRHMTPAQLEEQLVALSGLWGDNFWTTLASQQVVKFYRQQASFEQYMLSNFSVMMFFVLPVFAFLLKLLYIRHKRLYIEHLVFGFHLHTFCYLLFTGTLLLSFIYNWWGWYLLLLALILVYFWISLRKVYGQSLGRFLVKYVLLLVSYSWILISGLVVSIIVSFLLF